MFKNRYFIMGIGCGMIVGVLLLQLILTGQNMSSTLSKQQLEQEARRQGYELVMAENETSSDGEQMSAEEETVDPAVEDGLASGSSNRAPEQNEDGSQDELAQEKPSEEETVDTEKKTKQIQIIPNMTSTQIASQLAEAGIIDNAIEFDAYIKSKKKQTQLRAGKFIFDVPSTYEQALTTLTSPPNG